MQVVSGLGDTVPSDEIAAPRPQPRGSGWRGLVTPSYGIAPWDDKPPRRVRSTHRDEESMDGLLGLSARHRYGRLTARPRSPCSHVRHGSTFGRSRPILHQRRLSISFLQLRVYRRHTQMLLAGTPMVKKTWRTRTRRGSSPPLRRLPARKSRDPQPRLRYRGKPAHALETVSRCRTTLTNATRRTVSGQRSARLRNREAGPGTRPK